MILRTLGITLLLVLAVIAALVAMSFQDILRYLKMREM